MTRSLPILLLLTIRAAVASAQSAPTLSLDAAIGIALEHNRSVANAALNVEKAEHDVAIARTRRLPNFAIETQATQLLTPIDIIFPQGALGTYTGTGPIPAADTKITTPRGISMLFSAQASQPLTQLFSLGLAVRSHEAAHDVEREQLRADRLALVTNVKRLYYAVLQATSSLEATGATVALLDELNRVMANRLAQQVVLEADTLGVQTRLAEARLERLTLRHSLASHKEQLNQLLGRDVRTPFDVAGVPEPAPVESDLEAAQVRAIEARPDIRQARVRLHQAELARRAAKAEYVPEISFTVSYISPLTIDGAPRHIATAGLQLKWNPFDWGRKGRTVATRSLAIRQAQNAVAEAEQRAVVEISSQFRRLEAARARLAVARLSQESVRETARVRLAQYHVSAALLSDVLQAQASVADTNNQYQQALLAFWTAAADYEQALGEEVTK